MDEMKEFRRRVRRRTAAQMALIVSPIILLVMAVKVLEPHNYPEGDMRNEALFWLVLGIVAVALVAALTVGSIRELRRDRRE